MCGIGGFYAPKDVPMDAELVKSLWHSLEDRGTHAAGLAYLWRDSDAVMHHKQPGAAHSMSTKALKRMGSMVQYVLLHTRYTTKGSVSNNDNNHPVMRGGIIMTHNGVVNNHDAMMDEMRIEPWFEVDTEALVVGLAAMGTSWTFNKTQGNLSVAWIDAADDKEEVHLFTNGRNPLVIGRLHDGTVVWASCERHITALPIADYFHAQPGKVYTIGSDTLIRSKWIPGTWKQPLYQQSDAWRVF